MTSASVMRPSPLSALTRAAALTTGCARSWAIRRVRCFTSKTSTSMTMTEKSGAALVMLRLEMLASLSAITWAIWASVPGSLIAVTSIRAGKRSLLVLVDVPAHVEPALGLVVEGLQRRRLDRDRW